MQIVLDCTTCVRFVVEELELADPQRVTNIMEETYQERRQWIEQMPGPTMEGILTKYKVNITRPDEVIECSSSSVVAPPH